MSNVVSTNTGNLWTVKAWDREQARGVIACPQLGELTFDAAAAMVSDFRLGEIVHVDLEPRAAGFHVRRVWPDDPRFAPRDQSRHPDPPALRSDIGTRAAHILCSIPIAMDFRVVRVEDDLVVQGDDDQFAYGHHVEVKFVSVVYLEIPMTWSGRSFSLASRDERAYLAARSEMTDRTIAVRIAGDTQVFFVTCTDLESTGGTG